MLFFRYVMLVGFAVISVQVYIEATKNGKVFKGKVAVIQISMRGGISLGLALGVSVTVILLIVLIFIILFIYWKKRYPTYTLIERNEDGTGKKCYTC